MFLFGSCGTCALTASRMLVYMCALKFPLARSVVNAACGVMCPCWSAHSSGSLFCSHAVAVQNRLHMLRGEAWRGLQQAFVARVLRRQLTPLQEVPRGRHMTHACPSPLGALVLKYSTRIRLSPQFAFDWCVVACRCSRFPARARIHTSDEDVIPENRIAGQSKQVGAAVALLLVGAYVCAHALWRILLAPVVAQTTHVMQAVMLSCDHACRFCLVCRLRDLRAEGIFHGGS